VIEGIARDDTVLGFNAGPLDRQAKRIKFELHDEVEVFFVAVP
jgi:hypothetical protein